MSSSAPLLEGRTLLVTGAAHRLGAAITRALAAAGAEVVIHCHRSRDEAERLVRELGAAAHGPFVADLAATDGAELLLAACDTAGAPPDGIVHSAASFERRALLDTTVEEWDAVFALNLRAFFLLAQGLARRRRERGGSLVVISDSAGLELPVNYLAHSVAKAALTPLVAALARALAPSYRVNGVIPGPVLSPSGTAPEEVAAIARRTLLGRLGSPEDVASAVVFLLAAEFVTGAMVPVTGGSELARGRTAIPGTGPGRETREEPE